MRILFFNYILLGALDAHEDQLDDAIFWRDAAVKTLGDLGAKHPTTHTLEEYTQRRRDLKAAADLINSISGSHALPTLESSRSALEENPQARILAPGPVQPARTGSRHPRLVGRRIPRRREQARKCRARRRRNRSQRRRSPLTAYPLVADGTADRRRRPARQRPPDGAGRSTASRSIRRTACARCTAPRST